MVTLPEPNAGTQPGAVQADSVTPAGPASETVAAVAGVELEFVTVNV